MNSMLYVRGNRRDYDHWQALGNLGWSYRHVLPYFKKSEDNQNRMLSRSSYHSSGGYLTVSDPPYETPMLNVFIEAGKELGYEEIDINGRIQTGFTKAQGKTVSYRNATPYELSLIPLLIFPNGTLGLFRNFI